MGKSRAATDGSITRLANGKFWVRAPLQPDGSRPGLGTWPTEDAARQHLDAFLFLHANRSSVSGRHVTLERFGFDVLDLREEEGLRGVEKERDRWRKHVEGSAIGGMALVEVRSRHVREFARELAKTKADDKRGARRLKRGSVQRIVSGLSVVFAAALERDMIEANPCAAVKLRKRADEDSEDVWTFLTAEEQAALVTCKKIPYTDRVIIRFALATGIRQGELCHNLLSDLHVDGPEPRLVVRYGSKGKAPKSGKVRVVPLFGDGLAAAREWLELRPRYLRPHGDRHKVQADDGAIFPTMTGCRRVQGKPLGGGVRINGEWVDRFKHYCTLAGIALRPGLHWHCLRHTCATSLLEGWRGPPWTLDEIKELLGHSSVTVTERYAHHAGTRLQAAAARTGYGLVTGGAQDLQIPGSRFRDLNSRPTVYESTGKGNNVVHLGHVGAPSEGERNQVAERVLAAVLAGDVKGAMALAVTLASDTLAPAPARRVRSRSKKG